MASYFTNLCVKLTPLSINAKKAVSTVVETAFFAFILRGFES